MDGKVERNEVRLNVFTSKADANCKPDTIKIRFRPKSKVLLPNAKKLLDSLGTEFS